MQCNPAPFVWTGPRAVIFPHPTNIIILKFVIGYYFSEGNGPQATEWILFLQGGGWCYSTPDCYARSKTTLGSSKSWPASGLDIANMNGISPLCSYKAVLNDVIGFMTDNCTINPTFCNFSKVFVNYCDGTSFTSMLAR
jgi:O-palmitoleoyl-L-serine hydrolase